MAEKKSNEQTDTIGKQVAPVLNPPELDGMKRCIDDVVRAASKWDSPGPAEPSNYQALMARLAKVETKLPPLYREDMLKPLVAHLTGLGAQGFAQVLADDPKRESGARLLMDTAQAVLQQGEGYENVATDAFQEVVSDLYDGFLSAEDRRGVNPPDRGTTAPMVKWGNGFGPYTWPISATADLQAKAGVVSLPRVHARQCLVAWSALGHETGGHDILGADTGLLGQLQDAVWKKLRGLDEYVADYWQERIDETASDILGILNMGPAAAIGLVVFFRGLNLAFSGEPKLSCEGADDDVHPADILRGYLAAEVVAQLRFTDRKAWAKLVAAETDKDAGEIVLAGRAVPKALARKSAAQVASVLVWQEMPALESHALGDIQNWRDHDERIVAKLRAALREDTEPSSLLGAGTYAAHVVAAAVLDALAKPVALGEAFKRMLGVLHAMHHGNPSWGPSYLRHPGDIARRLMYPRARRAARD
jgi:hypothetical protein